MDTFQVNHEGTTKEKRERMNTLSHKYELFRMKPRENIYDMQKKFIHIMNHMRTLEKVFQSEDLFVKFLRFLNYSCQPKVTSIFKTSRILQSVNHIKIY